MSRQKELSSRELLLSHIKEGIKLWKQRNTIASNSCFVMALDILVELYQDSVIGYCINVLPHNSEINAEEVAQEIFIAAFEAFYRYRGESNIRTWLFSIARNKCSDAKKKISRRNTAIHPHIDTEITKNIGDSKTMPHDSYEKRELVDWGISKLTEEYKQIITLRDVVGLEYTEISAVLQKRENNIRKLHSRALQRLREIIENER